MRNSFVPKLCQIDAKRLIVLMCLIATTLLICQSSMLPYRNVLRSLSTLDYDILLEGKRDNFYLNDSSSSTKLLEVDIGIDVEVPYNASASISTEPDMGRIGFENWGNIHDAVVMTSDVKNASGFEEEGLKEIAEFVGEEIFDDDFKLDKKLLTENSLVDTNQQEDEKIFEKGGKTQHGLSIEQIIKPGRNIAADTNPKEFKIETIGNVRSGNSPLPPPLISSDNNSYSEHSALNPNTSAVLQVSFPNDYTSSAASQVTLPNDHTSSGHNLTSMTTTRIIKQKSCDTPPKLVTSIGEMNRILVGNRQASRSMKPLWSTVRDKEILAAKDQIQNAPIVRTDDELYAPLFRNVSTFKRSYELMERVLKVYVYKEGRKPIFHQPITKGLYASEGWFMKLMENNKRFLVKDLKKAHLFYMPFSSRMLEYTLYIPNSHNRTNLRTHLREYTEQIAAKYPFWNRTGGSDHFLVACHDWAPYETRNHMENCIKALCNADVSGGFKIGRDVSLPETYVRSQRNPQRDIGGKPDSQRNILAFYAGSLHGYLRPILLKHWKDKDPDMKIFGRMPLGVSSKMNYINYMKNSKYCICPKGYEVNSPRVVEAIFYECVPVIISDNFVPPLFDVLNWEAFSLIIAEKDIPNLKDILLAIPESKYLKLQLAVRRVQRHFLWHSKPLKYDLFHMILHSVWNNRVFQIQS